MAIFMRCSSSNIPGYGLARAQAPAGVGQLWIDAKSAAQRSTAEQHRENHIAAVGQIDFRAEAAAAEFDIGAHEPALRDAATGIGDIAAIGCLRFAMEQ